MTIPIWPLGLPQEAMVNGYTENYPNNLLRYSGESKGAAKVRKKGATPPFTFSATFLLTLAQRDTLKNFVRFTLNDGALRFEFFHPIDRGTIEARIVPEGDSLYSIVPLNDNYTVKLTIEILP